MRILIDLDGICCDLLAKWLRVYNTMWNDNLTKADIKEFHLIKFVKKEARSGFFEIAKSPRFFRDLPLIPGAKTAVHRLRTNNEVRLVSSPLGIYSFSDKAWWVETVLELDQRSLMLVPSADKHWLEADVLIDDKPSTIKTWKVVRPTARAVTIAYPYNTEIAGLCDCYAADHDNTEQAWEQIVRYIEELQ